jgi:glutaredoxin
MLEIVLYTKQNCSLCLKAKRTLQQIQQRRPFRLVEVDITTAEILYEQYRNDIPVATVNGEELFRHRVEAEALEKLLIERSN